MENEFYKKILRDEFLKRQRKNSNYSLRAYSRDIGLPSPVVSEVFNGKRGIPKKSAEKVAEKLGLSPIAKNKFIESLVELKKDAPNINKISTEEYHLLEEERNYKIISEWEHYAIFSLMDTKDFESDEIWIAKRLSVSNIRVRAVLENLINSSLIEKNSKNKLIKKVERLTTTKDVPSSALRKSHAEELDLAKVKLENLGVEDRYFSSTTLAVDKEKLNEVKQIYREFRERLTSILESGTKNEVYQFNFQAFPLTNLKKEKI